MGKRSLITVRDILDRVGKAVTRETPIPTTEHWLKFGQDWPCNRDKKSNKALQAFQDFPDSDKQLDPDDRTAADKVSFERYASLEYVRRKEVTDDVRIFTFRHGGQLDRIRPGVGQHMVCGFLTNGGIVERPYAMTRPIANDKDDGTIDLIAKVVFATEEQPGGFVTNVLDCLDAQRGDGMLVRGPEGPIVYHGHGKFTVTHEHGTKELRVKKVNFVSGGTGMVPIYTTLKQMVEVDPNESESDDVLDVRFIDCNPNEKDILLSSELDGLVKASKGKLRIMHILEEPTDKDKWDGEVGLIDADKFGKFAHPPGDGEDVVTFVCGPPPMMKAVAEAAHESGFVDKKTLFHY